MKPRILLVRERDSLIHVHQLAGLLSELVRVIGTLSVAPRTW